MGGHSCYEGDIELVGGLPSPPPPLGKTLQADLKEKKPDFLYSSISHLVLEQESQKSSTNCLESHTNDIKVNPTQKDTECL